MANKIKNIFLTSLFCTLVGCTNTHRLPDFYNAHEFSKGQKGVVILQFRNQKNNLNYNFKKLDNDNIVYFINKNHNSMEIIMLDPGIYYITLVSEKPLKEIPWSINQFIMESFMTPRKEYQHLTSGRVVKNGVNSGSVKLNSVLMNDLIPIKNIGTGAIEVKAGTVSYYGKIVLKNGTQENDIINDIEKTKSDLKKQGLPELAEKVQFEPLHQTGGILKNSDGTVKLVSNEEFQKQIDIRVEKLSPNENP